ncbi:MAG: transporter substrate-binding domain-containing protein [Pseudomonadota bacterium]
MKRFLVIITSLIFSLSAIANQKEIVIAADPWCPWNCDSQDKPGIAVDLVKIIFEPYGYKIKYEIMPWERAIKLVAQGEITAIIGASPNDADTKNFIYPTTYLNYSNNVYTIRSDSNFVLTDGKSLQKKMIGVVAGYHFQSMLGSYIDIHYNDKKIIDLAYGKNAPQQNIEKLINNKIDIYVDDAYVIQYNAYLLDVTQKIRVGGSLNEDTGSYIGFSPTFAESKKLANIYDKEFAKIKKNGLYKKILSKYGIYEFRD